MKRWWARRRPSMLVNAVLAVLIVAGVVAAYLTVRNPAAAPTAASTRNVAASTGPVVATVSATGAVQSASTANADFATSATVTEIDVKPGDTVTKGQVLAKVDPSAVQDQLNTANANLVSANQALARANSAATPDAVTIASAQAQVTQAQANVSAQQRALDGTVLKAPIAGTVTAVNGSVGASSNSGSTGSSSSSAAGAATSGGGAATGATGTGAARSAASSGSTGSGFIQLADLTQMRVSGYFAEADATRVAVSQPATVLWNALAGARATGTVASVAPIATVQNGVNTYEVVVSLQALPTGVRIGQTTTMTVTVGRADGVLRVPTAAVRGAGGRYTVQVVNGTRTETVPVQVGLQGDAFVEITEGLADGQQVALAQQSTTGTTGGQVPGGGGFRGGGLTGGGGPGGLGNGGNGRGGG